MLKPTVFVLFVFLLGIISFALIDRVKKKSETPNLTMGRYSGIVPLSDNKKLEISITFSSDSAFNMKEQLIDPTAKKRPNPAIHTGFWHFEPISKQITLTYNSKTDRVTTFNIREKDTIQMHDLKNKIWRDSYLIHKRWYSF